MKRSHYCLFVCLAVSVLVWGRSASGQTAPKGEASKNAKPTASASQPEVEPGLPRPEKVLAAMKKAAAVMRREVSFAGGYAWKWPQDMSTAHGEDRSAPSLIMIQPPGTPEMGLVFLRAYEATGDKLFLQAAKEAEQCLLWCQMATGGWGSDFDYDPRTSKKLHFRRDIEAGDTDPAGRHGDSTLDDEKTQTALLFLLELAHNEAFKDDQELRRALKFGFDGLIAAQAPNGGWPQHYRGPADPTAPVVKASIQPDWPHVWPGIKYSDFYTLNDNNIAVTLRLILRAYELEKDERYLASAKKAGDFLFLAILPDPQPVWAQQYNREMQPVWARKFEPPAACTVESLGAMNALAELWIATNDTHWLAPIKPAMAWFEKVRLKDGRWARFYELGTNKPIYCKAQTYELTFDDSDLPTHYGFKSEPSMATHMEKLKATLAMDRDKVLAKRAPPDSPKKWASTAKGLATKVKTAMADQDKKGWWLKDEMIDAALFVKHMKAMTLYVEAAKNGSAVFEELLKPAAPQQ